MPLHDRPRAADSDAAPSARTGDEPFCGACGYSLVGATESSRCPECGRPLVETLRRANFGARGKRFTSAARLFGLPLVHVALGPGPEGKVGRARGYLAVGDIATGVIAVGGIARGFVAVGGLAMGGVALGGASLGLLAAAGGMAVGGTSVGGFAGGGLCAGGMAGGIVAQGGFAAGVYARGGDAIGLHTITHRSQSPTAQQVFSDLEWFFGPTLNSGQAAVLPMLHVGGIALGALGLALLLGTWAGVRRSRRISPVE